MRLSAIELLAVLAVALIISLSRFQRSYLDRRFLQAKQLQRFQRCRALRLAVDAGSPCKSSSADDWGKHPLVCEGPRAANMTILFYTTKMDGVIGWSWRNRKLYARRHGYRLCRASALLDPTRHPSWNKVGHCSATRCQ